MVGSVSVSKDDYPAILAMADIDKMRTADIAQRYGVVPRTINIILNKARGMALPSMPATLSGVPADQGAEDVPEPVQEIRIAMSPDTPPKLQSPQAEVSPPAPRASVAPQVSPRMHAVRDEPLPRSLAKGRVPGAGGAKHQGHTLVARSDDGEETLMPFSSLEELLSSLRGVFREAARGGEGVWFSVRKSDLEDDHAGDFQ